MGIHPQAYLRAMGKAQKMSKSQIFQAVADSCGVKKKVATDVLDALTTHGYATLKKSGVFIYPGFAKFRVYKKKAVPKRFGKNPFTGEEQWFKAKPASKTVRGRAIKVCKDCV